MLSSRVLSRQDDLAPRDAPAPEAQGSLQRHKELPGLPYREIIEVVRFVGQLTPFATQHSVLVVAQGAPVPQDIETVTKQDFQSGQQLQRHEASTWVT